MARDMSSRQPTGRFHENPVPFSARQCRPTHSHTERDRIFTESFPKDFTGRKKTARGILSSIVPVTNHVFIAFIIMASMNEYTVILYALHLLRRCQGQKQNKRLNIYVCICVSTSADSMMAFKHKTNQTKCKNQKRVMTVVYLIYYHRHKNRNKTVTLLQELTGRPQGPTSSHSRSPRESAKTGILHF